MQIRLVSAYTTSPPILPRRGSSFSQRIAAWTILTSSRAPLLGARATVPHRVVWVLDPLATLPEGAQPLTREGFLALASSFACAAGSWPGERG